MVSLEHRGLLGTLTAGLILLKSGQSGRKEALTILARLPVKENGGER